MYDCYKAGLILGLLLQARAPPGQEPQNLPAPYDSQHETERKRQLLKLFNRTQEQVHCTAANHVSFFDAQMGHWENFPMKFSLLTKLIMNT